MTELTKIERYYKDVMMWCTDGCISSRMITRNGVVNCYNKHGGVVGSPNCDGCPYDNRKHLQLIRQSRDE